jgi:hypothetical protein
VRVLGKKIQREALKKNDMSNEEVENLCPICLECLETLKYEDLTHDIATLRCGHTFHLHCIMEWREKQTSCPNCRDVIEILPPDPELNQYKNSNSPLQIGHVSLNAPPKVEAKYAREDFSQKRENVFQKHYSSQDRETKKCKLTSDEEQKLKDLQNFLANFDTFENIHSSFQQNIREMKRSDWKEPKNEKCVIA